MLKSTTRFLLMTALLLMVGLLLPTTFPLHAQADPARVTVESYLAAQHKGDWKAFVGYFDPQDVNNFRSQFESTYGSKISQMDTTVMKPSYFGVKSLGELSSVETVTYVAGVFRMIYSVMPPLREMMTSATETILGFVDEGADMKHFVLRAKANVQNEQLSNIEVVSVRKVGGQWRVMGKRNMEQMANLLRRIIK